MTKHPHAFRPGWGRCPWPVCRRCGLVWLKNDTTERLVRTTCEDSDD